MSRRGHCRACSMIRMGAKIHQNFEHTCDGTDIPKPPKHEYMPTREELGKYLAKLKELMEGKK